MLHGIIRAATAALLFVIAILVYTNYIHRSDTVLPEHSELASAPDVPQVPLSLDGAPAAPMLPSGASAVPSASAPLAELVQLPAKPETAGAAVTRTPSKSHQQRAEIIESGEIAEVVELPPSNRPRGSAQAPVNRAAGKRTHMVQPGESLWVISKKYLGSGEMNGKIAEANGLTSRDKIKAGQLLVIPDLNGSNDAIASASRPTGSVTRVSEDLADDDDARRFTKISSKPENNLPASMSSTVQSKF